MAVVEQAEADAESSSSRPKEEEEEEGPPKPVSSESEDDEDDDNFPLSSPSKETATISSSSRLFAPYRTLGVVTSGRPFYLIAHENSQSHMVCLPIGDRFQLLQTDRLHPVLVSQAVPATIKKGRRSTKAKSTSSQTISHCISDSSLSITVVAHGSSTNGSSSKHVTLYHRTRPLVTRSVVHATSSRDWYITGLLHLGRIPVSMTGEKEGKKENASVVAVVLAKHEEEQSNDVPVVGDDDDDSSQEGDVANSNGQDDNCRGQVVIFLASRSTLTMSRRIRLTTIPTFRPLTAVHPATYVNKLVLGGEDEDGGRLVLINVRSTKVVHVFQCLPECGYITALEQSPAVDTIAVGTDCGKVHLINLRVDKKLFSLRHASAVTSLSFRTDGSAMRYGIAPMAVGRVDGTVTVWDLSPPEDADAGRNILCELKQCHPGGVAMLQYLPQEPLLLSIGSESNAILMHIFDSPNHTGRILKQRKGHTAPPTLIRYLHGQGGVLVHDGTDATACQILSTGGPDRSLRVFSTARSVLDKEFSQGSGLEKRAKKLGMTSRAELLLPPVKSLAVSDARSRDWGDLVTIHESHSFAYVWSTKRGAQSGPLLRQKSWSISAMKVPPPPKTHATSVAMSVCGSFALVGTQGGIIYKYNVQSGNQRGSYPRNEDESVNKDNKPRAPGDIARTFKALEKSCRISNRASNLDKEELNAEQEARLEQQRQTKLALASHTGFAVTGMAFDSVNRTVVSVGADKKLILWNFSTHAPHNKSPYFLPAAATMMRHIRESDLAAIAMEDFSVVLFDCSSLAIVRRFGVGSSCHKGPISDLGFSSDGRTLLTSSLDGTIRVYDVPTSSCVEWLSFNAPPTSLTVSPTGEFLATTHAGKLGINVWSDRSYYQTVHTYDRPLAEPIPMDDPIPITEGRFQVDELRKPGRDPSGAVPGENPKVEAVPEDFSPKQSGLVTLSGFPPAHWKTLFHLELVKERNKPIEPPKKPPSAPFFLQWRSGESLGVQAEKDAGKDANTGDEEEWAAAWSDDEEVAEQPQESIDTEPESCLGKHRRGMGNQVVTAKRRKVTHCRSQLASLLQLSSREMETASGGFQRVTDHVATLGPSAIDVALSSLCNGAHDLDEGLPLMLLACSWLTEACSSRERFEVVNAYLHRFLFLHAPLLAEIQVHIREKGDKDREGSEWETLHHREKLSELIKSIEKLKQAQLSASKALHDKVQHSLCLLRHLSRMV